MKYVVPAIAAVGTVTLAIVGIVSLTAAAQEYVLNKEFRFGVAIEANQSAIQANQRALQSLKVGQREILDQIRNGKNGRESKRLTPADVAAIVQAIRDAEKNTSSDP